MCTLLHTTPPRHARNTQDARIRGAEVVRDAPQPEGGRRSAASVRDGRVGRVGRGRGRALGFQQASEGSRGHRPAPDGKVGADAIEHPKEGSFFFFSCSRMRALFFFLQSCDKHEIAMMYVLLYRQVLFFRGYDGAGAFYRV